jgi:hypothetical protein
VERSFCTALQFREYEPRSGGSRVILDGAVTILGQDATILGGGSAEPGQQAVFFIDAPASISPLTAFTS